MATIAFPERQREAVKDLFFLSKEERAIFLRVIQRAKPTLNISEFIEPIEEGLPAISKERVQDMVRSLSGISTLLVRVGETSESVADGVIEAIKTHGGEEYLDATDEDFTDFRTFLLDALSPQAALALSAKALRIMHRHENVYREAAVITDIRPVFQIGDLVEAGLSAAVLIHMLRMDYWNGGQPKSIYFALDRNDLLQLKAAVERALNKHQVISSTVSRLEIPVLDPKED